MAAEWIIFAVFPVVIIIATIGIFIKRKKGNRINYTVEKDKALDDFISL